MILSFKSHQRPSAADGSVWLLWQRATLAADWPADARHTITPSNLDLAELVSSTETETATAGERRGVARCAVDLAWPSARRWPVGAAPQPQSRPNEWHRVRELPPPMHLEHADEGAPLHVVVLHAQSRPAPAPALVLEYPPEQ